MAGKMSKISTVYDALISKISDMYPLKSRVFNPYELSDNASLLMKDAWGLKVLSASRVDIEFCNLSIERTFILVLCRNFITASNKDDGFDAVSKLILEDQQVFLGELWKTEEIGQATNINKIEFTNIGGIDFIVSDEKKFLFSEIEFTISISESTN